MLQVLSKSVEVSTDTVIVYLEVLSDTLFECTSSNPRTNTDAKCSIYSNNLAVIVYDELLPNSTYQFDITLRNESNDNANIRLNSQTRQLETTIDHVDTTITTDSIKFDIVFDQVISQPIEYLCVLDCCEIITSSVPSIKVNNLLPDHTYNATILAKLPEGRLTNSISLTTHTNQVPVDLVKVIISDTHYGKSIVEILSNNSKYVTYMLSTNGGTSYTYESVNPIFELNLNDNDKVKVKIISDNSTIYESDVITYTKRVINKIRYELVKFYRTSKSNLYDLPLSNSLIYDSNSSNLVRVNNGKKLSLTSSPKIYTLLQVGSDLVLNHDDISPRIGKLIPIKFSRVSGNQLKWNSNKYYNFKSSNGSPFTKSSEGVAVMVFNGTEFLVFG